MKIAITIIAIFGLTLANADKPALPVLYRVDQPNSNVVVFRGANVAIARAAGLLPGGSVKTSPPVVAPAPYRAYPTPAPYVAPAPYRPYPTPAPYVAPTTPYVPPPPPTTTPAPVTTPKPPPPTPAYRPAPVVYRPAPVVAYRPAPVAYRPAPIVYKPAPRIVYKPVASPKPVYPAHPASYAPAPAYADVDPNYTWEYNVDDAHYSHFGHKESRSHYLATGVYYVNLPDGRTQTVTYTADENGYVPVVTYSGEATYPDVVRPAAGYAA